MKKEDLVIGNTYVVKGMEGTLHTFAKGDKVIYTFDDGSNSPRFKRKSDGKEQYVTVTDVKGKATKHDLTKTYAEKVDDHRLTLEGDGSTVPFLKLSGDAYVYASDLRTMAKQLNKWAKGLEASGS